MADVLPIAYLDGEFLPIGEARISPLDRGFLFGDAVYEVIPVYQGRPLLLDEHVTRLANSLDALQIDNPLPAADWRALISELARRNGLAVRRDDHPSDQEQCASRLGSVIHVSSSWGRHGNLHTPFPMA